MIYDLLIVYVPKFALNMADNLGIYSTILYIYIYMAEVLSRPVI